MTAVEPRAQGPEQPPDGLLLRLVKDRRVAFLAVGAFNTVNALVLFVVFQIVIGDTVGYLGVLLITHVVAVIIAFLLHRYLVFRVRGHLWLDLVRFEMVNLGALGLNAALLFLLVEVAHLPVIPAQMVAGLLTVATTYIGHHSFSFRRSSGTVRHE